MFPRKTRALARLGTLRLAPRLDLCLCSCGFVRSSSFARHSVRAARSVQSSTIPTPHAAANTTRSRLGFPEDLHSARGILRGCARLAPLLPVVSHCGKLQGRNFAAPFDLLRNDTVRRCERWLQRLCRRRRRCIGIARDGALLSHTCRQHVTW